MDGWMDGGLDELGFWWFFFSSSPGWFWWFWLGFSTSTAVTLPVLVLRFAWTVC